MKITPGPSARAGARGAGARTLLVFIFPPSCPEAAFSRDLCLLYRMDVSAGGRGSSLGPLGETLRWALAEAAQPPVSGRPIPVTGVEVRLPWAYLAPNLGSLGLGPWHKASCGGEWTLPETRLQLPWWLGQRL